MTIRDNRLRCVAVMIMVALCLTMFSALPANAADNVVIGCITNPDPSAAPGDDLCTIETGAFIEYDGSDLTYPGVNALANDVPPGQQQPTAISVGRIDSALGFVSVYQDSDGFNSFAGVVYDSTAESYAFTYVDSNFNTHTVTVVPHYTAPIAMPTVRKAARKGILKACEPSRIDGGGDVLLQFGRFGNDTPDGSVIVPAGTCVKFRVHRRKIDYIAMDNITYEFLGEGHVRHIRLPKGDGPHVLGRIKGRSAAGLSYRSQHTQGQWNAYGR